jgi:LuxR family transcriptional regulator, quorum-sensing system regulator BjaR1
VKHDRETPDALRFYTELQQRMSVSACSALFKDVVAGFGMVAFACGELDLADRDRSVMFIAEWPQAWRRYYEKSGLVKRDPLINAVAFYRRPFEFADIVRDPRFSNADRDLVRAAAEHGWSRGLAVPVARGGSRYGLVTMIGHGEPLGEFRRAYLCLISECLLSRTHALQPNVQYAMPPAGMSQREVEAARLVAAGCSDPDIAVELGISESTAHKHVEAGRKRLNARNRAHMAALSVSLGIATTG